MFKFNSVMVKDMVVCGDANTAIKDQKILDSLGMSIKVVKYFPKQDVCVYEGTINRLSRNIKVIEDIFGIVKKKG